MILSIGKVAFTVDEFPSELTLGGTQNIAVKHYAGGGVDIQTLGAFDRPISWDGTFWFQEAMARVQQLNAMRIDGAPVMFQIGQQVVSVVIHEFTWTYRNDFYIGYHIELQPSGVITTVQTVSQNQQVAAALAGASVGEHGFQSQAVLSALVGANFNPNAVQVALTPTQLADPNTLPLTFDTAKLFGAAADTPVGTIVSNMSPPVLAPVLSTVQQISHLVSIGETLWSIATKYFGDGRKWTLIAAANAIQNPNSIITGLNLTIPSPIHAGGTGGTT